MTLPDEHLAPAARARAPRRGRVGSGADPVAMRAAVRLRRDRAAHRLARGRACRKLVSTKPSRFVTGTRAPLRWKRTRSAASSKAAKAAGPRSRSRPRRASRSCCRHAPPRKRGSRRQPTSGVGGPAPANIDGEWLRPVHRSALALKLLIYAPSGASAAAPTTSLPEEIGGERNWDYRCCWIRDSNFVIHALLELGCYDEAKALFWWFMQATALTEPELHVLYRLDGGIGPEERDAAALGLSRLAPGRVGNGALEQMQLDIYGDLFETAWLYSRRSPLARPRHGRRPRPDRRLRMRHLAASRFGDLGSPERPVPFHALEGHVLGGARPRPPARRTRRDAGPARGTVAERSRRDRTVRRGALLVRPARQLYAHGRRRAGRREPADAAARRLRRRARARASTAPSTPSPAISGGATSCTGTLPTTAWGPGRLFSELLVLAGRRACPRWDASRRRRR